VEVYARVRRAAADEVEIHGRTWKAPPSSMIHAIDTTAGCNSRDYAHQRF
jgi:hypothetical protein